MSRLVKLIMEEPECCIECQLMRYDDIDLCNRCGVTDERCTDDYGYVRPTWCPLELVKDE